MEELLEFYSHKKSEIKQRLSEFSDSDILKELVFCLCTPQSKAVKCWDAVQTLFDGNKLCCYSTKEDIESVLREKGVRFPENKAKYIASALKNIENIKKYLEKQNNEEKRRFLAENIKGIGMKEAGHFLRNIGHGKGLAILDRHILRNLKQFEVIDEIPKTLTPKKYLEIEKKMKQFCGKIGIPLEEMDLLLWAKETGFIFK